MTSHIRSQAERCEQFCLGVIIVAQLLLVSHAVFILQGRCIFASGSPFDAVSLFGNTYRPGQCNNSYIFPGLGLAVVLSHASKIPDEVFLKAARVSHSLHSESLLDSTPELLFFL